MRPRETPKAIQHNTYATRPRQSFSMKNELPRAGLEPAEAAAARGVGGGGGGGDRLGSGVVDKLRTNSALPTHIQMKYHIHSTLQNLH